MKILAILALLVTMVSCNSPSKSEVALSKLCMDMQKGFMQGQGKAFDEAKEQPYCACQAEVLAPKCGAKCETEEGATMFVFEITGDMNKEIGEKCKRG